MRICIICRFRRPREKAVLERVEQQGSTRLRPSEQATHEGASFPGPNANAITVARSLQIRSERDDADTEAPLGWRNLDVRLEEFKLRMAIIMPESPRRERSSHRRRNVPDDAQDTEYSSRSIRLWRTSRGLRAERKNHLAE